MSRLARPAVKAAADHEDVSARYYVIPALVWGAALVALGYAAYGEPARDDEAALSEPPALVQQLGA